MTNTKSEIAVTFNPQEWVDGPYHLDDGQTNNLTPAENREPVTFEIPWEDGTDEEGTVFPDESYEANQLQSHPAAPEWVRNWDGPYYVRTKSVADE